MHIHVLAVGGRQPSWVESAFDEYRKRLPRQWRFRLDEIPAGHRSGGSAAGNAVRAEGEKILARIKTDNFVVVLDERGHELASRELSARLSEWQAAGNDLRFVIGGPDGVSPALMERADFCWSLSRLTLPHGLVRVMLAEQLYRAWAIVTGHPYHRE